MKNPLQLIDKKGYLIVFGSAALATLITVIVIVLSVSARDREARIVEAERRRSEQAALASSTNFSIEDFYLDTRNPGDGIVYPARSPKETWSPEEVDAQWIDPAEAGISDLSDDNDKLIFDMLGVDRAGENP